jgi:hypothetical protein
LPIKATTRTSRCTRNVTWLQAELASSLST